MLQNRIEIQQEKFTYLEQNNMGKTSSFEQGEWLTMI